jgi:hypothetical protein
MTSFFERLTTSKQITEWVDRHDERLVRATGEPAPNGGATVRTEWQEVLVGDDNMHEITKHVARLLVPNVDGLRGSVWDDTSNDDWRNTIALTFSERQDWLNCFPIHETSGIPELAEFGDPRPAWGGVAICENEVGLAVFAQEREPIHVGKLGQLGVTARIQPVPPEIFEKI